jgi:hypothetical protein
MIIRPVFPPGFERAERYSDTGRPIRWKLFFGDTLDFDESIYINTIDTGVFSKKS